MDWLMQELLSMAQRDGSIQSMFLDKFLDELPDDLSLHLSLEEALTELIRKGELKVGFRKEEMILVPVS